MVLVANNGVLPLRPGTRIALLGPRVDDAFAMLGCYTFPSHVGRQYPKWPLGLSIPTLLEATRRELPTPTSLTPQGATSTVTDTVGFAAAIAAASSADVCVVALGDQGRPFRPGYIRRRMRRRRRWNCPAYKDNCSKRFSRPVVRSCSSWCPAVPTRSVRTQIGWRRRPVLLPGRRRRRGTRRCAVRSGLSLRPVAGRHPAQPRPVSDVSDTALWACAAASARSTRRRSGRSVTGCRTPPFGGRMSRSTVWRYRAITSSPQRTAWCGSRSPSHNIGRRSAPTSSSFICMIRLRRSLGPTSD